MMVWLSWTISGYSGIKGRDVDGEARSAEGQYAQTEAKYLRDTAEDGDGAKGQVDDAAERVSLELELRRDWSSDTYNMSESSMTTTRKAVVGVGE